MLPGVVVATSPPNKGTENFGEHVRPTVPFEAMLGHLAGEPAPLGFQPRNRFKRLLHQIRALQFNRHGPPRIIERANGNAVSVLPVVIALSRVTCAR